MPKFPSFILLVVLVGFTAPALAQLQVNPYVGLATGNQSVALATPTDGLENYAGDRLLVGVDVLAGAGQWAPLAGLVYRPTTYESDAGEVFNYGHIYLPLGIAYRLLAADFDINVLLHGALAPGISFGDGMASGTCIDHGLNWLGRGGVTLYLGTVTLGGQFVHSFGEDGLIGSRGGTFVLTLGGRF